MRVYIISSMPGLLGTWRAFEKWKSLEHETNLPIVRETKLRAHARLKRKIQIGAIEREGLLCVSDNAALDSEIGLQHLAVAPEHAEADGVTARPGTVVKWWLKGSPYSSKTAG